MTAVNPVHPSNALLSIVVTDFGIVTVVSDVQPSNELVPMFVIVSGISMDFMLNSPLNASL